MAFSSLFGMPASFSTVTLRPARLLIVGGSGVFAARFPPAQAASRLARSSGAKRLLLGRIVGLPGEVGAVVELRDRKTRLGGVDREPFLLARELGDGDVLHHLLLLAAERGHARDQDRDATAEAVDAAGEGGELRGLVLLRLRQRGVAPAGFGELGVHTAQCTAGFPDTG